MNATSASLFFICQQLVGSAFRIIVNYHIMSITLSHSLLSYVSQLVICYIHFYCGLSLKSSKFLLYS